MRKLTLAILGLLLLAVLPSCRDGELKPTLIAGPSPTAQATKPSPEATPTTAEPASPSPPPQPARTPRATPPVADIQVLDDSTEPNYPKTLTFRLRARSSIDIAKITLSYTTDRITVAPVVSEVRVDFKPSTQADVQWVWDMRKGGPPGGAKITYQWLLEDASGARLRTEKKSVVYQDPRFESKSRLGWGDVTIYWYQGDLRFGQTLMDAAQDALKRLEQDTGSRLERPVKIFIYASAADLRSALVFPQEWTGGMAFTEYAIIAIGIPTDRRSLEWGKRTIAHELAHQVTFQVTFNPYGISLPTWLSEGLSQYAEGDMDRDSKDRLNRAIEENKLFSAKTLSSSFSSQTDEALVSYAQSDSLVRFLIEKYGKDRILEYLGLFKQGVAGEEGLKQVYGFDYVGLDAAWRKYVGAQPQPVAQALLRLVAQVFPQSMLAMPEVGHFGT